MSQDQNREEDSQNNSKIKQDKAEIIMDNLSYAEQFIDFRESDKMTDETTMDDFLDHAEVPEDLRSDFMVAAMLKQVQDLDIESGKLKIEESYRRDEVPAPEVQEVQEAASTDLEEIKEDIENDNIPVISKEDTPTKVQREKEAFANAEQDLISERDNYINGGGEVSFFKGLWNLLVDGKWNPEAAKRKAIYDNNPITIEALRLLVFKDMIIDVPNVSAIFYREQDNKLVIQMTGRASITREIELVAYHELVARFLAVIAVMHKMIGEKYQLGNYIIHDKCVIKKNRILCAEFKRGPGLGIIELKGGSHVNVRITRKKYNEIQSLILAGKYNA